MEFTTVQNVRVLCILGSLPHSRLYLDWHLGGRISSQKRTTRDEGFGNVADEREGDWKEGRETEERLVPVNTKSVVAILCSLEAHFQSEAVT